MTDTESLTVVDATRRSLEIEDLGDQVRIAITLSTHLDAAPARVWPMLTDIQQLATWYGQVEGDLSEGGRFRTMRGASGRVLEIEAPHKLSLTWEVGDAVDPLLIRLDPEDDGTTLLRLRHTVLMPRERFEEYGPGYAAIGWEIALLALAAATGAWEPSCGHQVPAPTPDWLASADGAAHLRAWSIRWAAEAVAAGVDEQLARRGEDSTIAAHVDARFSGGRGPAAA